MDADVRRLITEEAEMERWKMPPCVAFRGNSKGLTISITRPLNAGPTAPPPPPRQDTALLKMQQRLQKALRHIEALKAKTGPLNADQEQKIAREPEIRRKLSGLTSGDASAGSSLDGARQQLSAAAFTAERAAIEGNDLSRAKQKPVHATLTFDAAEVAGANQVRKKQLPVTNLPSAQKAAGSRQPTRKDLKRAREQERLFQRDAASSDSDS